MNILIVGSNGAVDKRIVEQSLADENPQIKVGDFH